ncbi:MAG: D-aminoacylase [Candidatus Bathyarchaeota archaeon]|jgi:N-acyl-D-amino-acid deacylase
MVFDIVISGSLIVDGSGREGFTADLGIKEGRIAEVGDIPAGEGEMVVQGTGLVLTPGFIDMHSHSDIYLLANPRAESKIRQGVTTEVTGNCGSSAAPAMGLATESIRRMTEPYGIEVNWSSFGEYLDLLGEGVSLNVAALVGHGTVRQCVMDLEERAPTAGELGEMKDLVAQAMREGAFGMSSGLVYPPGRYADTEELTELCRVVAEYGGIYASHIRGERETLIQAVEEALEIGERSGVSTQISHHPAKIGAWGRSTETLRLMDETAAKGINVMCDLHPYIAGATGLSAILPPWAQAGGTPSIVDRLKDPELRKKMREDMISDRVPGPGHSGLVKRGMWDKIIVPSYPKDWPIGKTISDIAKERGQDPFEAYFDLVQASEGQGGILGFYYNEDDIRNVLTNPRSVIGSDGSALAPYGVLGRGKNHPRSYGTFPMIYRKYVRGESRPGLQYDRGAKLLSLEGAVKKMTSLPAEKLGIGDRGLIKKGYWADLVLFDQETIADTATYMDPYRYPAGIKHVLVNGVLVIEDSEHTGALPGKPLRH